MDRKSPEADRKRTSRQEDQRRRFALFDGQRMSSVCYNSTASGTGLNFLYKHWIKGREWRATTGEQLKGLLNTGKVQSVCVCFVCVCV